MRRSPSIESKPTIGLDTERIAARPTTRRVLRTSALFLFLFGALFALPVIAQEPDDHASSGGEPPSASAAPDASDHPADPKPDASDHPADPKPDATDHPADPKPDATDHPADGHDGDAKPDDHAGGDAQPEPTVNEDGEPIVDVPDYDEPAGADDYGIGPDGKIHDPNDPEASTYEVGEPSGDNPEGLGVDGKDYELPAKDFEGMEGLDPANLEALKEVTPAELGELDIDPTKGMTKGAEKQLEAQAHALEGMLDPQDINKIAKMYLPVVKKKILEAKKKTHDKMLTKQNEKLAWRMNMLAMILGGLSFCSFFILLMPLFLKKKFPGQGARLFKISLYTALAMFGSFLMLSAVLIGMRFLQAQIGQYTNPALVFSDGVFDAAANKVEDIAASPGLILEPIVDVTTGKSDDLTYSILQNASQFKKDALFFLDVIKFWNSIKWIMAYVPMALIILAVVLFLLTIKDLIKDVLKVPERVMKGELKDTDVFVVVGKRVKGETIATLCTLGVLLLLTLVSAVSLALLAAPTMENMIRQIFVTIQYLTIAKTFDKTVMYIGMLGVLVFIVLTVVISIASTAIYLGKAQKIFRAWFNYGYPYERYKGYFLGWRSVGVVWCLAMPAVMLFAMSALANYFIDKATNGAAFDWNLALLPGAIALPGGLLLVFLALFGLKTITSCLKYKVEGVPMSDAAVAQVLQAVGR